MEVTEAVVVTNETVAKAILVPQLALPIQLPNSPKFPLLTRPLKSLGSAFITAIISSIPSIVSSIPPAITSPVLRFNVTYRAHS
jgi:hypothetical protein